MAPMALQVGQAVDLQPDKRLHQHIRDHSIGDVFDALVEFITNADDSYDRLFQDGLRRTDGGDILVECAPQRGASSPFVVVRDRAEGMSAEEMYEALRRPGAYSSKPGNRGYMGRGAKDCTALGRVVYESVKGNRYYRCVLTPNLQFVLEANGSAATSELRRVLGVGRGNGTSVTLELDPNVRLPRFQTLVADLPWHYALRVMMSDRSDARVLLRRAGGGENVRLRYVPPEGQLVVHEEFDVPGYLGAKATISIWRAPEPLEDYRPRFERFGILVKGQRAVHECSLLCDKLKTDPGSRRYFGLLECPYIDQLMREYEERRAAELPHPPENPRLLLDPNRRTGLDTRHPFVGALYKTPIERFRRLLDDERQRDQRRNREIGNQQTQARLRQLAKLASKFLRQRLDEVEELAAGDAVDGSAFSKQGILIYPTYVRIGAGQERSLTLYVRRALASSENPVELESDCPEALALVPVRLTLKPHRARDELLVGTFRVRGLRPCDTAIVTASRPDLPKAEAAVRVVEHAVEDHDFRHALEFGHGEYAVRMNSGRTLHLYARCPDLVVNETEARVHIDDPTKAVVRGRCLLRPVVGTNYATAEVHVEGRSVNSRALIVAQVGEHRATAALRVIDKPDAERAVPIEILIVAEDFGHFRAQWATHEGRPNLLKVSARHESVARYLGPERENFPGQDSALFRLLLAEIVAESVCRKALGLEAKERPWEFRWVDLKEPDLVADEVLAEMQRRVRDLVADAHRVMLSDADVRSAISVTREARSE